MKVLIAIDGSACSLRATRCLIQHWSQCGEDARLVLVHVDPPFVERALTVRGPKGVGAGHERNAKVATEKAEGLLKRGHVPHTRTVLVGEPGPAIARFANEEGFDLVIMGSHGHGAIRGLLLGSVVTKVLALCTVPVLIVR